MSIQYPKLNMSLKNELLIFLTSQKTSAFLPISVNGNSFLPVAQAKTLQTSLIPPLPPLCTPQTPIPRVICWQVSQANLVAILQKYIFLNWNPSQGVQDSTTSHHLHYSRLGHHHSLPGFLQSPPNATLQSLCSHHCHPTVLSQHGSQKNPQENLSHVILLLKPPNGFPFHWQ